MKHKKGKRSSAKTNRLGQRPSGGFSQAAHVARRYPPFPRQFQFSSRWTQTREVDLGATSVALGFGLFDFLGRIPEYALETYSLFRYCRIVGLDVDIQVVGESDDSNQNFSFETALARVPYDQIGLTPQELRLVRGSHYKLNPTSGMNRCVLRGSYGSIDELGNPVLDRQFWQTITEAQNTTPADGDRPVIALAVRSVNGNRGVVSINISLTYHMQFFESMYKRILNANSKPFSPTEDFEPLGENSVVLSSKTTRAKQPSGPPTQVKILT